MKRLFIAALATGGALGISTNGHAVTLFTQLWDGTETGYSSQNDTNGNGHFATTYDDFSLASSAIVTGLDFTGVFFNPSTVASPTAFNIEFHADAAGQPGALIASSFIPGDAGQNCFDAACSYSVAVNFVADAGITYWLAIYPDLGFPPQWGWATASNGNGVAYQDFMGDRIVQPLDLAFTLSGRVGRVVPEPATWAMMIGGFALVGAGVRRRAARVGFAAA